MRKPTLVEMAAARRRVIASEKEARDARADLRELLDRNERLDRSRAQRAQ